MDILKLPFFRQTDYRDCGIACLKMVVSFHHKSSSFKKIQNETKIIKYGISLFELSRLAEILGFKSISVTIPFNKLYLISFPCIAYWKKYHFIVIYEIINDKIIIADPAIGIIIYDLEDFRRNWLINNNEGILLLIEPNKF